MLRKILSLTLSISLLFQYSGFAQTINLADYLSRTPNAVALDRFRPLALCYFSYEPSVDNFKILLDKGDQKDLSDAKIKDEADRLLTYFKIGLSLPNEKFWVNLRPDAEDQIIDPELEKTDLGKVLLEADLQLKKDTSSLTSPQSKEGKAYWEKLYKKAGELFGTENITIPTITRPWIVPGEIIVRESQDSAYIYKAVLKVMLEEDYLKSSQLSAISSQQYVFSDPRLKELNKYSTELIKETILPELTKRINSSKDYASLRQVYFSLILARWFKDAFGGLGSIRAPEQQSPENSYVKLIDSGDLTDLTSKEAWSKTAYFNEYKKSFNDGEYNLSEKIHTPGGQAIRRYTSGGGKLTFGMGDQEVSRFMTTNSPAVNKNMFQISTGEGALKVGSPLVEDKELAEKLKGRGLFDLIEEAIKSNTQILDSNSKQWVFKIPSFAADIFISCYLITPGKDDPHYKNNVKYRTIEVFPKNSNNLITLIRVYDKNDEISVPAFDALAVPNRDSMVEQLIDALNATKSSSAVELKEKKGEFEKLLAGILGAIKKIKPSKEIDKDLTLLDFKNADDASQEIHAILKEMDSVSDLNGLREKVNAAIVKLLSYIDAGRIDKEIGKLKELYASLNADILADRFYRAGLTKAKLEGVTLKDIKPIEIENNFPGLPGSYYVSRYHLLDAITVEGAEYYIKVSHYEEGRRPHRIMELVPKDKPDTLEPLIRFRVFEDGIAPEISYAGHKEPKKKDSDEPAWEEAKRKAFAGLFNVQPQNVDRLQKDLVSDVERILNERAEVFSMGKFVVIGSQDDKKLSGFVQRLEQANVALSERHPELKVTTPLNLVWVKDLMANEIASADTIITDPETANKIGESFIPILSSGDTVILQRKKGASSSLALIEKPEIVGGIDFRQMHMLIQPQGSFASSSLDFSLPELNKAEIEAFDLAKELELIQRMASSGIDPIDERLKKYLAVCFARGKTGKEIDDLKLCLEDVFIAQQLDARQTPDGYKEVIVIADTRRFVLKESRLAAGKGRAINLN